jgi:putative serine protease PepD
VESAAAEVLPSVVKIDVAGPTEQGSGSGIILSSDGEILTNNHVVEVAGPSGTITIEFNDGTHAPAKILGTDPLTDTAVVQAQGVNGLKPATIGKSAEARVGQEVVAIGSPMGLNATVTQGIVSALNRPVNVGTDAQGNSTVYPAIQTDAAINPGNSGGALVDLAGHVIGINSSILTTNSSLQSEAGSIGLGFAIPIDEVIPLIDEMAKGETPTHARLGISVENAGTDTGAQIVDGAKIRQVNAGSAAESAGLQDGDVITKIDGQLISDSDALVATIRSYRPGDTVSVTYTRGGDSHTVTIKLDSDSTASNS